ncbi:S-layer homology domain-containing protein [Paenibacillus montanisoli]|uniref:S-layer homology domain-containing protein n=1 Tax=Paenibacillus montanisoli TaxID=2081970 RepID=UPI0014036DC7|nr:S-layer homology domain-containing protein [Paenibacillus montanisoli]
MYPISDIYNLHTSEISMSADGRYIAFTTSKIDPLGADFDQKNRVFIYDTKLRKFKPVGTKVDGSSGNVSGYFPSISPDGRYVAFASKDTDLFNGDTSYTYNIFVYDRELSTTRVVMTPGENTVFAPTLQITAGGTGVIYDWEHQIYYTDLGGGDPVLVTHSPAGEPSNGWSGLYDSLSSSADGRTLAFASNATNLAEPERALEYINSSYTYRADTSKLISASHPPLWPVGASLASPEQGTKYIMLQWPAVTGTDVAFYQIYRNGELISLQKETYFMDTGLEPGTAYEYQVIGGNDRFEWNEGLPRLIVSTKTGEEELPQWPSGAQVTATASVTGVSLRWPAAIDLIGIDHYLIEFGENQVLVDGDQTGIDIPGLLPGTEYTFRLHAVNASGQSTAEALTANVRTLSSSDSGDGGGSGDGGNGGGSGDGGGNGGNGGGSGDGGGNGGNGGGIGGGSSGGGGTTQPSEDLDLFVHWNEPVQLDIHRLKPPADPVVNVTWLTDMFQIGMAGNQPWQTPVEISFRYDQSAAGSRDIRKAALFRRSTEDPTQWIYVGGWADTANGQLTAKIDRSGIYAVRLTEVTFEDLAGHWGRADIEALASRGIVNGTGTGTFKPKGTVTRAEFIKMLVIGLAGNKLENSDSMPSPMLSDVRQQDWFYSYMKLAATLGWVKGDGLGLFRPNDPVTREEMAVLLINALGLSESEKPDSRLPDHFSDRIDVTDWAKSSVSYAVSKQWIRGLSETKLAPKAVTTRAQAAALIMRVLTEIESGK